MERMIAHTVKEVKVWGDPSVVLLSSSIDDDEGDDDNDVSSVGGDVVMGGTQTGEHGTQNALQHKHVAIIATRLQRNKNQNSEGGVERGLGVSWLQV